MRIIEIFKGIQGEGKQIGRPTVFVRTAGCNLRCSFCDSKYSWTEGIEMTPREIVDKVIDFLIDDVTITGGEPGLQDDLEELVLLLRQIQTTVHIETNGTFPFTFDARAIADIICSPKKANGHYVMHNILRPSCIKIVVKNPFEIEEALEWAENRGIDERKIWFMPEAANRMEYMERAPEIWQSCVQIGLNFSPREHIVLFDQERGR